MSKNQHVNKKSIVIGILLLIGFCAMEFPGVLFFGKRVRPFIFGMPFIYGYILCCWAYMCLVFWYACKCGWGRKRPVDRDDVSRTDDD